MNKKRIKIAEETLKICLKNKTPLKFWIAPISQEEKKIILERVLKEAKYE